MSNLCGHALDVVLPDGSRRVLPSDGLARCEVEVEVSVPAGDVDGIPVVTARARYVVRGLPAPTPGVVYVVSTFVAAAVVDRDDVVCPATDAADRPVTDRHGRTTAVRALKRLL